MRTTIAALAGMMMAACGDPFDPIMSCSVPMEVNRAYVEVYCEAACSCELIESRFFLASHVLAQYGILDFDDFAELLSGRRVWVHREPWEFSSKGQVALGFYDPVSSDIKIGTTMVSLLHEILHLYDDRVLHLSANLENSHAQWADVATNYSFADGRFSGYVRESPTAPTTAYVTPGQDTTGHPVR